jgi:hypothetical protein
MRGVPHGKAFPEWLERVRVEEAGRAEAGLWIRRGIDGEHGNPPSVCLPIIADRATASMRFG